MKFGAIINKDRVSAGGKLLYKANKIWYGFAQAYGNYEFREKAWDAEAMIGIGAKF